MLRDRLTHEEKNKLLPVYTWFAKQPYTVLNPSRWSTCAAGAYVKANVEDYDDAGKWVTDTFDTDWPTGPLRRIFLSQRVKDSFTAEEILWEILNDAYI